MAKPLESMCGKSEVFVTTIQQVSYNAQKDVWQGDMRSLGRIRTNLIPHSRLWLRVQGKKVIVQVVIRPFAF